MKRSESDPILVREGLPADDAMVVGWKTSRPGPPTHLGVTAYDPDKFWRSYTFACSFGDPAARARDVLTKALRLRSNPRN